VRITLARFFANHVNDKPYSKHKQPKITIFNHCQEYHFLSKNINQRSKKQKIILNLKATVLPTTTTTNST
jgi:hypothetical protein